ncbi:MAG: hypothetical protein WKF75_11570 [Singulisphaera sp.]
MGRFSQVLRRRTNGSGPHRPIGALLIAAVLGAAGCGEDNGGKASTAGDDSGLLLPPGFQPVDLPVETRKTIFRDAHQIRALAVQEANQKLPMDQDHMPKGKAFEERIAEHKAIIDGILEEKLPALAERNHISGADLRKIEEEAMRLRWTPPEEPNVEEKGPQPGEKAPTTEEKNDKTK